MSIGPGAIAVVTGAGSGIGRGLCEAIAARGASVVVTDVDGAAARETLARLRESPGHRALALDVADADAVAALAREVDRDHGIDYWFNNAGIAVAGETQNIELSDWRRVLDVNLRGVVHGIHAVYPLMVQRGRGHIVNIASVAGLAPYPFALPYTTSKHAVVGLSTALRAEARGRGVCISVACPGSIDTAIWTVSEVRGVDRDRLPTRRPGAMSPAACARAILRGVDRNRSIIPITGEAHLAWRLTRWFPGVVEWIGVGAVALMRRRLGI